MRRYLFILVLIPLFAFGQETASGLDDPLDFELEELGVNDGAELRVLRGNFYYSYLIGLLPHAVLLRTLANFSRYGRHS